MKRDAIDLGSLNVFALFSKYFIPTLLGMLSMSAVTAIDGIYVGHGIGSDAIAAINICIPVLMLFTGVGLMVGAGVSVVASIQLSRGQVKAARINVTQALLLVTLLGVVCCGLMMAFPHGHGADAGGFGHAGAAGAGVPRVVRTLAAVPDVVLGEPVRHPAGRLAPAGHAVQRGGGAGHHGAGLPLHLPPGVGAEGAALAGTLGLLVGGSIGLAYIFGFAEKLRPYKLKWSAKSLRLTVRNWGYQCRIGSSALLTEATMAMLMFVGNHVCMQYLGDDGVGAFGIACYYMPFVFMVGNAIAQSAQPIISYNFGLGRRDRVADTERVALLTALVCGVLVTAVFVLLPGGLVGLFLPGDNPAARIAIEGFPLFAAAFAFFILNLTVIGYYQSVERMRPATLFALLRGCVFLVPSFMLLPKVMGTEGIWLALCLSEGLTTLCIVATYLAGRTKPDKAHA